MSDELLEQPLQESVLAALLFGSEKSQALAGFVEPSHFSEPYRKLAERAISYRLTYNRAPGREHADDVLADTLKPGAKDAQTNRRILIALLRQSERLNEQFVLDSIQKFTDFATLKAAILRAGQQIQQAGPGALEDARLILGEALSLRAEAMDPGTFLGDEKRALAFLERRESESVHLGIPPLDERDLVPTRGEFYLVLGKRKSGKSMLCTHVCSCALLQKFHVLDVSLEMNERKRVQRMFQNLYGMAKRADPYQLTRLQVDKAGQLVKLATEAYSPTQALRDKTKARDFILEQMRGGELLLNNLCIKEFPSGSLTTQRLESHLDYLEHTHNFVPDVVIVDMPLLMAIDMRHPRLSLGRTAVELRGLAQKRNFMLVAPHQGNRPGEKATTLEGYHSAEDISFVGTADTGISLNSTKMERARKLARIFVFAARNDQDKFEFLISQDYDTAQFVIDVARAVPRDYWETLGKPDAEEAKDDDTVGDA